MKERIWIAGACRTAIGKFGGALTGVPVRTLGATVIREVLQRAGLPSDQVDEVILGCVIQAGLGQNVARQAALDAGLPQEIPAYTLNQVCGSGLMSVNQAASRILAGEAEVVVAGGMENMSAAPYLLPQGRFGYRMNRGTVEDAMVHDALWDAFGDYHMGITAENIAERYGFSREEQDAFAARSQQRCEAAQRAGRFDEEIVAVPVRRKKETILFAQDESPRSGVTPESLARLKPAFRPDGTVTAGNASSINDGAAAVVLVSDRKRKELGLTPLAEWKAGVSVGVDPAVMGLGAAASIQALLKKCGRTVSDVDLFEANEAFAAQSLAAEKILGYDPDRVNVNGGAIALGHPVGASGCRILVTLLYEMKRRGGGFGVAGLCIGGGMGTATAVEI